VDYSTLVLQTEDKNINALLYSKNKRQLLMDTEQFHTPSKIQKFTKSAQGEKIIINDMTKLSTPDQTEYGFQFEKIANPGDQIIPIEEILNNHEPLDSVAFARQGNLCRPNQCRRSKEFKVGTSNFRRQHG
jgi:hypothetical protein